MRLSGIAGAPGLVATDAGDPGSVRFRFTERDDDDIGILAAAPAVARFRTGAGGYHDFAVAPGKRALFLLALDKEPQAAWQLNLNYYKLGLPAIEGRLAAPALVPGGDGAVRYAYAGDAQGNLWRFNFSGAAPWADGAALLFTALDPAGKRQPITTRPAAVFAAGGYLVLFGTGKRDEAADAAGFSTQSFYALFDTGSASYRIAGRDNLTRRLPSMSVADAITVSGKLPGHGPAEANGRGWYFDFMDSDRTAERSVTDPMVVGGKLFFDSLIPNGDGCGAARTRSYVRDALTGLPVAGGMSGIAGDSRLPAPAATDIEGDAGSSGDSRMPTEKYAILPAASSAAQQAGSAPSAAQQQAAPAGRLSWREVFNRDELRQAWKKSQP
jgi:type IV pilus assembly protein PilY1